MNISDYSLIHQFNYHNPVTVEDRTQESYRSADKITMRGLRKSESAWEVSTAVSSRESGYHSGSWPVCGHSQDQLQSEEEEKAGVPLGWPDHLHTGLEGE